MLTKEPELNIVKSGLMSESSFKIKASAKAFQILSSGLYSNKIRAVVRELGTNAADAQIAAGNSQTPFLVHLPNNFEAFFSIRDYGTGLSPDDILNIYTTYFESNKTQSNEFTGCLGLGSKSPFAYTDNFTVVDYYNGAKHTYTVFTGEAGAPKIALVATEETTEPNGLEVSLAVKPADFSTFRSEAQYVYNYFKVKPTIVGNTVEFTDKTPFSEGVNWKLYANTAYGSTPNVLIMGNVAYPINLANVGISSNILSRYSIEIEVPIGEAEMTASRESLEYTEKTKKTIKSAIQEALDTFTAKLDAELQAKPTLWDATVFFRENRLFLGYNAKWNGQNIEESITLPKSYNTVKIRNDYGGVRVEKNRSLYRIVPDDNTYYVENDCRGATERCKEIIRADTNKSIYLVSFGDGEKDGFVKAIGTIPAGRFIQASTLPKPVRTKTNGPATPTSQSLMFQPNGSKIADSWEATEVDLADGGVYVEVNGWSPTDFATTQIVRELLATLKSLGYQVDELIGFRKKLINKVKDDSNWKSLKDYALEVLEKLKQDEQLAMDRSGYQQYKHLLRLKNELATLDIGKLINTIEYVDKHDIKLSKLYNLMHYMGNPRKVQETAVSTEIADTLAKYPLVNFVLNKVGRYDTLPAKEIAHYIQMVDAQSVNSDKQSS